jgi:drug/metabolite transporter (DMT)-like permease
MSHASERRATLIGASALALWATLAVLTTATGAMPPFLLVALSFGLAAMLGFAVQMVRGLNPLARLRQPWGAWALSVGGLFGYHALYFLALKTAPAVEANLVNYLWPLLIVLFSALLPGAGLSRRHVLGAALGFAGAALLILGQGGGGFEPRYLMGYGAALGCAMVWSGYSVANRRYRRVPSDAVSGFCAATSVLAALAHLMVEPAYRPSGIEALAVLAMGLGPAGLAFFVWDYGVKHGDVRTLGTLAYGTPLASTLLLVLFGGGSLDGRVAAAALLIVAGGVIGAGALVRPSSPTSPASPPASD